MLIHRDNRLYSASDLVNFMGCGHATTLDVRQLTTPVAFPEPDAQTKLLQDKGIEHERAYLESLRAEGRRIVEIPADDGLEHRAGLTVEAMQAGVDVVYQGALFTAPWHGYSDFLLKVDGVQSSLGPFAYDVADTKLSRSAKPKHVIQLCVYGDLLTAVQGVPPPRYHVALGTGEMVSLDSASVSHYFGFARTRFTTFADMADRASAAEPCGHCLYCRWSDACAAEWEELEHLSLVAGMTRGQIGKLRAAGVASLRALAALPPGAVIPTLNPDSLTRLQGQAGLQLVRRDTGEGRIELLELIAGKGFDRLPMPADGDLFFDMEGDPLFDGGLEYLFGFVHLEAGAERFTPFWAHDRAEEKLAFEHAVDFIVDRLGRYPGAHIYHYAAYEETALKRLAMFHGTRETDVDDILRGGKLVDLYRVVREAIRTSEPGYSIKNLEAFYLPEARGGGVKTAGDSIVAYESWRRLSDPTLLQQIADYNELDCHSTRLCRDWLISQRPEVATWLTREDAAADAEKDERRREAEVESARLATEILAGADDAERPSRELLCQLLDFHRREAKPDWWAMFAHLEMTPEELLEDASCLAGLQPDPGNPPYADKRSTVYAFRFPAQDFKLKVGDEPLRASTGDAAGTVVRVDEEAGEISLKLGPSRSKIDAGEALIPKGPVGDVQLREAVRRYGVAVAEGLGGRYGPVSDILAGRAPRFTSGELGAPVIAAGEDAVLGTISALPRLDNSYLLIQGPPGSGKTFTSGEAIAALLKEGKTVGVASNSHKAINNLLLAVHAAASRARAPLRGVKKSSREDQYVEGCPSIMNTTDNKEAAAAGYNLVAGTAWLFARPEFDQRLDYLFVDEAGQVSLANIVAMGVSARNIVLVGDQMQLAQPIKGDHPGKSGLSALQHLLGDHATVPPDRGVFLSQTRRMHPALCEFISQAVYDGRLEAHISTHGQRVIVDSSLDPEALAPAGLRFVTVEHSGRTQRAPEEVERLRSVYDRLLGGAWISKDGVEEPLTAADILVVSPYNMQVELLRAALPPGARVGTVDKFQGQEAAVVLISMATSSGDDLPRQIEFLYSRNRLNVAVSRARCLAVVFANPRLLEIACSTIEQMKLVNTLCWTKTFGDAQRATAA
jgi:predicted RecB family nuclease